jgi:hypothetical protein
MADYVKLAGTTEGVTDSGCRSCWLSSEDLQFAKGDKTVPNPTASALIRAGDLADRATFFRNDLAFAANPATPKNPHTFLTNVGVAVVAAFAVGAQHQIGVFFATDGAMTIDPDGPGPFFEVPIAGALPETLNFIP